MRCDERTPRGKTQYWTMRKQRKQTRHSMRPQHSEPQTLLQKYIQDPRKLSRWILSEFSSLPESAKTHYRGAVWFGFLLIFFSFPQPEELVFRWAQRSEPKDRIFQTGGWASSSEKSEDSWALPIWQIPSQTGSVGAWGLVTKRKVPRGIYKGQLALWKHLRGARVSTMLKANTCIALDSEQKTETRRELWNPHSGHLTAIKKKCVRHDGVCAFLYRNMVLL